MYLDPKVLGVYLVAPPDPGAHDPLVPPARGYPPGLQTFPFRKCTRWPVATTLLYGNCPKAVMAMYLAPRVLGVYLVAPPDPGAPRALVPPALAVPPRSTNIPLREMYQVASGHLL